MMSNDERITLRLPTDLKAKVQNLATDLNISLNDAFKMVIKAGLKNF